VKDLLGIHPAPAVGAQPEYHTEATPEKHLEPRAYGTRAGEVDAGSFVSPLGDPEDERIRRVVDEERRKTALELNAESARAEEGQSGLEVPFLREPLASRTPFDRMEAAFNRHAERK
jgi:hypothetical protein